MDAILDILLRGMDIVERLRTTSAVTDIQMLVFGALLVFGVINCILGYRLLRFWMMLFGFVIGAGLGYGASFLMGIWDTMVQVAVAAGVGVVLAVIVFLSYKAGIFVMGAGLGLGISIYVLHPTTSLMFFICLLVGVGLGSLAMKWAREVIIVGTSLLGGAMAGMALAKLGGIAEFPYGIGLSAAFAALGMLIQFATNRRTYIDDDDEEEYEELPKKVKREEKKHKKIPQDMPVKRRVQYEYEDEEDDVYEEPIRVRSRSTASRRNMPVDFQIGEDDEYGKGRYYGLDSDKTIVYRPKRKSEPEFDLPLDSYAYDDSYGKRPYPKNSSKKITYKIKVDNSSPYREQNYFDEDSFYDDLNLIDEEELDEEILREMMEEEDRASILPWKHHEKKNSRKEGHHGKRS